jgi:hypothetical protein
MSTIWDEICEYAENFIGRPYLWGHQELFGSDAGLDCSGYVILMYQAFGVLPKPFDSTADGLWNLKQWASKRSVIPVRGGLVFFGKGDDASHVELCLGRPVGCSGSGIMIGASGGDKTCLTPEIAFKKQACVKIRPISERSDMIGCIDPFVDERIIEGT